MSIAMITMMLVMILMICINMWTYIPKQRPMPRHSAISIAIMQTFDRPAMVPIECGRKR